MGNKIETHIVKGIAVKYFKNELEYLKFCKEMDNYIRMKYKEVNRWLGN